MMQKYYRLRGEFLKEIIGCKGPQIKSPNDEYSHWGSKSIRKIGSLKRGYNQFFKPEIPEMEIKQKAHTLDVLRTEILADFYNCIVISDRLLSFIKEWKTPDYGIHKINLFQNDNKKKTVIKKYNILAFYETINIFIDYTKSNFLLTNYNIKTSKTEVIKELRFDSHEAFISFVNDNKIDVFGKDIKAERIILCSDVNYEIFRLDKFGGYIVSERVKNAIEQAGFTGMRFELAENIVA